MEKADDEDTPLIGLCHVHRHSSSISADPTPTPQATPTPGSTPELSPKAARAAKRKMIAEEILSSEESYASLSMPLNSIPYHTILFRYVGTLRMLVDVFYRPLSIYAEAHEGKSTRAAKTSR